MDKISYRKAYSIQVNKNVYKMDPISIQGLATVKADGEEREDGAGDGQVGDEGVDLAVNRSEYPVSSQEISL